MIAALALCLFSATPDAGTTYAPKATVLLAATPEVFDKWAAAKPAERASVKGLVDKVKINERMLLAIALDGYELPRSRLVDLVADVVITDSTGRVVMDKASACGSRVYDPKTQTAVLLKPLGALNYGVTDPEGVYSVKVTIRDQIRGDSAKTVTQFTVSR